MNAILILVIGGFRVGFLRNLSRVHTWTGHAILFVSPTAKVDQLATLRTKRTPRIVPPFD